MKFYFFFLLLSLPAWGATAPLPLPEVETLANGLTVAWFLNDRLPVVDISVLVKAGFRDDLAGKSGTAELLAASLDRGVAGQSALQVAKSIEVLGGSRFATANDDTLNIGIHGLAPDAESFLEIFAKLLLQPDFPEPELKRERAHLIDRWGHIEDYTEALVLLAYRRLVTAGSSYGRGNVLSIRELEGVSRQDVVNFYRRFFTPRNCILTVIGRVKKETFRKKLIDLFGGWQAGSPQAGGANLQKAASTFSDSRFSASSKNQTVVLIDRPQLTQAQIRIGSRSPLISAPEHYALRVANAFLGEIFNSRLNASVRDKAGLTYSINSSLTYNRDFAEFTVNSATPNQTVGQLVRKTVEVLKEFKKGTATQKEVELAKNYLIGGFPMTNSNLNAVAGRWLTGTVFGLGSDYLNEFIPKISAVTLSQVQDAMKKAFDLDHLVVVVAGDAELVRKSLQDSEFKISVVDTGAFSR